jgi:hypothetical protein
VAIAWALMLIDGCVSELFMRPAPPPPPAPRIAFPVAGGGSIDLVSSGEEDDNEIWTMPPSQMAIQSGVSVLKQAALGPKGVQAVRRTGCETRRRFDGDGGDGGKARQFCRSRNGGGGAYFAVNDEGHENRLGAATRRWALAGCGTHGEFGFSEPHTAPVSEAVRWSEALAEQSQLELARSALEKAARACGALAADQCSRCGGGAL